MNRISFLVAASAILATTACGAEEGTPGNAAPGTPVEAVPPPASGDWSSVVSQTPEGGYLMGNPNAPVKLVEFGSMTCPHCADFDANATKPLVEDFIKTGRVSFEYRNFVRDPLDMTASLIARCGGPERFFPLTHAMFADQDNWFAKVQSLPADRLQALSTLPPQQQFVAMGEASGLQQWAAMRGVPSAKAKQCLSNEEEVNRLVQMNSEAVSTYSIPGTPSFLINGELVEGASDWTTLEPKLRSAVGG